MTLKTQSTTSDYIVWSELIILLSQLERDKKYREKLLLTLGCYWGLRISQIIGLTWKDILNKDKILFAPQKGGKAREIEVIPEVKTTIIELYKSLNVTDTKEPVLSNRLGRIMTRQYVNILIKKISTDYDLKIEKITSHSMRKTFGRRLWEKAGRSEEALILLSDVFGHSSSSVTKIYLGIRRNEIRNAYHLLASKKN